MNRIESENRKKVTYKSKMSLSCFDNEIYLLNSGYNGLALVY